MNTNSTDFACLVTGFLTDYGGFIIMTIRYHIEQ